MILILNSPVFQETIEPSLSSFCVSSLFIRLLSFLAISWVSVNLNPKTKWINRSCGVSDFLIILIKLTSPVFLFLYNPTPETCLKSFPSQASIISLTTTSFSGIMLALHTTAYMHVHLPCRYQVTVNRK